MKHFHFWCQKVLPLVYDDSLSYYEVLCKVVAYINALIDEDAKIIENVDELRLEIQRIQQWIRDFTAESVYKSVKDYGALGDGEHDDTQAFQDMLADNENYGFFYIPAGTYLVGDTLDVPSNCRILCDGVIQSTMTDPGGGVHVGLFDLDHVSNVTLSGLNIVGQVQLPITDAERSRTPHWQTAIYIHDSDAVVVDGCKITLWEGGYCVLVEQSRDITVRDCYIKTYKFTGIALHYVTGPCEHCKITGNSVIDCYSRTISGESGAVPNTYPIKLAGYDTSRPQLHVYPSVDVICNGNYIENYFGWWEGIDAHGGNNLVITNNVVIGCAKGITISDKEDAQANYRLGSAVISGNVVENMMDQTKFFHTGSCFCVEVSGGENVSVIGNDLKNGGAGLNAQTGRRGGVYLAGVKDALVADNNITGATVSFFDIGAFADGVVIRGNKCRYNEDNGILTASNPIFFALNVAIAEGYVFTGVFEDNMIQAAAGKENREAQGSSVVPAAGSYFKLGRNTLIGTFADSGNISCFALTQIRPAQIGALVRGRAGDIVTNSTPADDTPMGWMCKRANGSDVTLSPAEWIALPTLSE